MQKLISKFRLLFFVNLLWFAKNTSAQSFTSIKAGDYNVNITAWGASEGFLPRATSDMIEDREGVLWLISDEKNILQFNGKKFKSLTQAPRGDTLISNLSVDSLGNVWTLFSSGTSKQIFRFDPFSGLRKLDIALSNKIVNAKRVELKYTGNTLHCYAFTEDSLHIYAHTDTWQLVFRCHSNRIKNAWVLPSIDPDLFYRLNQTETKLTVLDKKGTPVQKTISFFDTDTKSQESYKMHWYWTYSSSSEIVLRILNLHPLQNEAFYQYMLCENTFLKTNIKNKINRHTRFTLNHISGVQFFNTDYVIGDPGLIHFYDKTNFNLFAQNIDGKNVRKPSIFGIARSGTNTFWLTSSIGLLKVKINKTLFQTPLKGHSEPSIRSIIASQPDSTYLMDTYSGSYILEANYDIKKVRVHNHPFWSSVQLANTQSLQAFEFGDMYIQQLSDSYSVPLFQKNIGLAFPCMHVLPNGNILLGHTEGLSILKQSDLSPIASRLTDTTIYCFYESPFALWLGTNWGAYNFKTTESLGPQFSVNHMYQENESTLWLATNSGLVRLDTKTSKIEQYSLKEGLSHNKLHSVYPDGKGNLWLSSDHGLMLFNRTERTTQTFFREDGIANDEFNRRAHYRDESGRLFLGGVKGLTIIEPDREYANAIEPLNKIHIKGIQLFNKENERINTQEYDCTLNEPLNITAETKRIEISIKHAYSGFNEVSYQWRIKNDSSVWQEFDSEKIMFYTPQLDEYTIELRVLMEGNLKNSAYHTLSFRVKTPFYKSGFFFFFIFLITVASTFLTAKLIYNQNKKRLEILVELKTKKIQDQTELITNQKNKLELINKTKSRFLTNISHDFKTPLSIISLASEKILESRNTSSLLNKYINKIQSEIKNLVEETRQIHDLAKLEEGSIKPEHTIVEWQSFCKHIFTRFEEVSQKKFIEYSLTVEKKEPFFLSLDKVKIIHVISNVLENAFKFTPKKGSIRLQCSLEREDAVIQVIDSGPGVEEGERKKIFERYYQGKTALPIEYTGTGIGLSFCKELLEVLGGSIRVVSNNPSTFVIRFPKTEAVCEAAGDSERILEPEPILLKTKAPFSSDMIFNLHKPTLLLVEDNLKLLESLKDLLAPHYGLILAKNGRVALDLLESKHNVDLIISDIMMDEMDGFTLLDKLRNNDSIYTTTPFIFISAMNDMKNRMDALRLGVDCYIAKPFQSSELMARIENLLSNQKKRSEYHTKINNSENKDLLDANSIKPLEQVQWLKKLEVAVHKKIEDSALNPQMLAEEINISVATLNRRIKTTTGLSPAQYIQKARMAKALDLLQNDEVLSIAKICNTVGIKNHSHFTSLFKKEYGHLPSSYLKV